MGPRKGEGDAWYARSLNKKQLTPRGDTHGVDGRVRRLLTNGNPPEAQNNIVAVLCLPTKNNIPGMPGRQHTAFLARVRQAIFCDQRQIYIVFVAQYKLCRFRSNTTVQQYGMPQVSELTVQYSSVLYSTCRTCGSPLTYC